ncbi:MAG: hypothetical protein ACE5HZ_03970 [Fidelibacterota bacterium]
MTDQLNRISWIVAALFVLGGVLSKFAGVQIVGIRSNISYFHAANTALLFGILFSLQRPR